MKFLLVFFGFVIAFSAPVLAINDSLIAALSREIPLTANYDQAKIREINQLKNGASNPGQSLTVLFGRYEKIYGAYKVFNYDSAYSYAVKLISIADSTKDEVSVVTSRLNLSFILLSTGLYKETYDSLFSLSKQNIPQQLKGEYYLLWGRYYYDLAGYANDHFHSLDYDVKGNEYLDSALQYYNPSSFEFNYYSGLKNFKQMHNTEAAHFFEKLMASPSLDLRQVALTASTLSAVYMQMGSKEKAINLLIEATLADIRSSTKETVAIFHLAELLHKEGDLKHAAMCIESAISNAEFYGARQRKIQASSILPLIEGERINGIEAQKNLLVKYSVVVTLLGLALIALAWIVLKQVKELKRRQQALKAANDMQQAINNQLERSNTALEELNEKLVEANKIKEEYIGYFFNIDSEFYTRLDKIKNTIETKLNDKRYDDIKFFLNKIDARKEKEELVSSFDKLFTKLFPNFVDEVNALLRKDEQVHLKEGELLNTDLRIFALMRMGITDPEKIAQILEYSVKTIYSYKSRIKNKAAIPVDEFEERVMQIKTL